MPILLVIIVLSLAICVSAQQKQVESKGAECCNNRGVAYVAKDQFDHAISDFDKALEINQRYAEAHLNRGTDYTAEDRVDLAIGDYSKAVEINPRYSDVFVNRGIHYDAQKQHDLAIADFGKALEINSRWAEGYDGQTFLSIPVWIMLTILYLSRRRAIGGWLLCFYVQLYLSTIFLIFVLPTTLSSLRPGLWKHAFYVLHIVSTVPVITTIAIEVWAATKLLFRRSEKSVAFLRKVLAILAAVSAVALFIEFIYFKTPMTLYFDIITMVFSLIWFAYFLRARRIQLVFNAKTWDKSTYPFTRVLTPEDRSHRRRRTMVAAAAVFLVSLLIMVLTIGDKKPDRTLFTIPLIYAAIAALIAWYLPLGRRASSAQVGSEVKGTETR